MKLKRSSGILLHPTSLPSGVLDEHAFRFVDWLAAAGQRWWQVLPLGPPEGITGSPYMSPSAFAGSPELVAAKRARVTHDEGDEFRRRHAQWLEDWLDYGGLVGGPGGVGRGGAGAPGGARASGGGGLRGTPPPLAPKQAR